MLYGMDTLAVTTFRETACRFGTLAADALVETLWPSRCALCDEPGEFLCDECRRTLPFIDWWEACPRCGAPFGRTQCCYCHPIMLESSGRVSLPFSQARSAVALTPQTRRMVTTFKDKDEQNLAEVMGGIMANVVPPDWQKGIVTFVPASKKARTRRGFDHAELLAQSVATHLELPCLPLLQRPRSLDQRTLSRSGRFSNMQGSMRATPGITIPSPVMVIDDVYTTGATLFAASDALKMAGGDIINCLTFARAW